MSRERAIVHPGDFRWETHLLLIVTAALVVFGLASMYGASSIVSGNQGFAGSSLALRQLAGAVVGTILLLVAARVDYHFWRAMAWPILLATIATLLILVLPFTTAIAPSSHGARRWIRFGVLSFQPSEVARLAVVVWCAMLAAKKGPQVRRFKKGVLPFLVILGLVSGLIMLEPDLSMATLVALVGGIVLFTAGAKIGHFLLLGMGGILLVFHQIRDAQYRLARFTTFLNPGEGGSDAALQIQQSLIGMGSGRIMGVGFGEGQQKLGFLPLAYSDFLFSTIGEEWGFLGVVLVVLLFGLFAWLGFRIAKTAADPFGQYLAAGITASVVVTAAMHMAVTLGLMPTTGLTLPFMSHGRTSLVVALLGTGILINIGARRGRPPKPKSR
ncbi:MAG TPA: putative peptidoglycan glycosyltransferase FtsW [Gemmatimonadales bacterium]|nr:putative peptidoglycan glycosyltransferase FtsW [Gemmatimonadales bacterium]